MENTKTKLTMKDLNASQLRYCEGCGDFGVIATVKKLIIELDLELAKVVNVSGIGCSSRGPHYINTYGFNGIHGRAIPLATGLGLARPDLDIIIHSGDGDAVSIGGNHLFHGINKNMNCIFLLYNNGLYSLTKSQTSPTTKKGHVTNTSPYGAVLDPINIMRFVIGVGGSFVASSADWMMGHLLDTLRLAHAHKGFSFVHIWQRCPHFYPDYVDNLSPTEFAFLSHEKGIPVPDKFKGQAQINQHDPADLAGAFKYSCEEQSYLGLFYRNPDKPCYADLLGGITKNAKPKNLDMLMQEFSIK